MRLFQRKKTEINSSSMADIAFLLLIFFLVTTTIQTNQGLNVTLPPHSDEPPKAKFNDRNLFKVHINSVNKILIEEEPFQGFERRDIVLDHLNRVPSAPGSPARPYL